MLACKGIFAKPSIPRASIARRRHRRPKDPRSGAFRGDYTMKQKCLLARAFLRSRKYRGRALLAGGIAARKIREAELSADIIP